MLGLQMIDLTNFNFILILFSILELRVRVRVSVISHSMTQYYISVTII